MVMSKDETVVRSFFAFDCSESDEQILLKFNLFCRRFYPKFFGYDPAEFHDKITLNNLRVYKGDLSMFVNIVFRGAAKTTLTKLFIVFVILNDQKPRRKFFKVLTKDVKNGAQIVTDIYNMIISAKSHYPNVFQKTDQKKEERMDSFTTHSGVKVRAGTVGQEQRGQIQEASRPDFIWFDDFETRVSLRSAVETRKVWDNMEEAKTGLSKDGGCVYTCNYLSERGNVHRLVEKKGNDGTEVLIVPIIENNVPTWDAFTLEDIRRIEQDADDFAGEYLCQPSAGDDIFFARDRLDAMPDQEPIRIINGHRIYKEYRPDHAYGIGADVAGGVGLDSSASEVIDFSVYPHEHVGSYESNEIKPEAFGAELVSQGERWGEAILGIENNKFDSCISAVRNLEYYNIYKTQAPDKNILKGTTTTYGWNTNRATKPRMLLDLQKAIEDGLLVIFDPALKAELRSYTRDDMLDSEPDPRLVTRHWDKVMALAIAWQMRNHAQPKKVQDNTSYDIMKLPKNNYLP